jgi:hypothetical protein
MLKESAGFLMDHEYVSSKSIEEPRSMRSTAARQNLREMFCRAAVPL